MTKFHDASSRGVVVYDTQGKLVVKKGVKIDAHSNNEAEYLTLEIGLQICLGYGIRRLQVKGDALLVVKQVLGVWQTKNTSLKNMCSRIKSLLRKFDARRIKHIDWKFNEEAHAAAQNMITKVFIMKADAPLYLGRESLAKQVDFLLTGVLPDGIEVSKKYFFIRRAYKYKIIIIMFSS